MKARISFELVFLLLHYSITPADCRKGERLWEPLGGRSKARSFVSGFFTIVTLQSAVIEVEGGF